MNNLISANAVAKELITVLLRSGRSLIPPHCDLAHSYIIKKDWFTSNDLKLSVDDFSERFLKDIQDVDKWTGHSYTQLPPCVDKSTVKMEAAVGVDFHAIASYDNIQVRVTRCFSPEADVMVFRADLLVIKK